MDLKVSNLGKPRHPFWKKLTRFLVISLPLYIGAVAASDLDPAVVKWLTFVLSMLVATVQGLSEFTAEPETIKTDEQANEKI